MKAVIYAAGQNMPPCVVKWTGRKGLGAVSITWCETQANAANGVIQVPDEMKCCARCEATLKALKL